ncbi:MAG TPA: prepilin-type N-terminal cleavage/methylation domain-containing protein [Vicinamibacterales bacterium]
MSRPCSRGFTLVELLLVISILIVLFAMALPVTSRAIDALRTQGAARYLAGRILQGRSQAISRSTIVGFRFVSAPNGDYSYRPYIDGNRNGIRTADISRGDDTPLALPERLGDNFGGVVFGLLPGIPDADGAANTGTDGVRIGSARILTTSPDGTATGGTLYVHGKTTQYAVRVLGTTGRVRVMEFRWGDRKWINR